MKQIFIIFALTVILFGCASTKSTVSKAYDPSNNSQLAISVQKSPNTFIPDDQYQLLESQRNKKDIQKYG